MLRIWGRRNSINVQKVLWTAAELGLDFELTETGGQFGGTDREEFRARNPNGLVPVIDDDGFVLWESNVIVRYLASRHGGGLSPADLRARASADRWMDWQAIELWPGDTAGLSQPGAHPARRPRRCGARARNRLFRGAHCARRRRACHAALHQWRRILHGRHPARNHRRALEAAAARGGALSPCRRLCGPPARPAGLPRSCRPAAELIFYSGGGSAPARRGSRRQSRNE